MIRVPFQVGTKVTHPVFGDGIVCKVELTSTSEHPLISHCIKISHEEGEITSSFRSLYESGWRAIDAL